MKCPNCNKSMKDSAKVCGYCGTVIESKNHKGFLLKGFVCLLIGALLGVGAFHLVKEFTKPTEFTQEEQELTANTEKNQIDNMTVEAEHPYAMYRIGEFVTFGAYEQDNDLSNGAEDIIWMVVDQNGNKLTLLSYYGLDAKPYNDEEGLDYDDYGGTVNWGNCSLREWLNTEFSALAFSEKESDAIVVSSIDTVSVNEQAVSITEDKVFLLSGEECSDFFKTIQEDNGTIATAFAQAEGSAYTEKNEGKINFAWLRDSMINMAGSYCGIARPWESDVLVRPAVVVDLNQITLETALVAVP